MLVLFGDVGVNGWINLVLYSWDGNIMLWSNLVLKGVNLWFDGIIGVFMLLNIWIYVVFLVNKGIVKVFVDGV